MSWLLDTNIVAELRKGERAQAGLRAWFSEADEASLCTSVLVVGELRRGIEFLRRRDIPSALALEHWLAGITGGFADRILPVDQAVAERWGRLNLPDPVPMERQFSQRPSCARSDSLRLPSRRCLPISRAGAASSVQGSPGTSSVGRSPGEAWLQRLRARSMPKITDTSCVP